MQYPINVSPGMGTLPNGPNGGVLLNRVYGFSGSGILNRVCNFNLYSLQSRTGILSQPEAMGWGVNFDSTWSKCVAPSFF